MGNNFEKQTSVDCLHNSREPKISNEVGTSTQKRSLVFLASKPAKRLRAKRRHSGTRELSPTGGSERCGACVDDGQAIKSARGMPWHQEPTKDVTSCDKLRGGANIR